MKNDFMVHLDSYSFILAVLIAAGLIAFLLSTLNQIQ